MTTIIMLATVLSWTATWLVIVLRLRQVNQAPNTATLNRLWLISLLLHSVSILTPWIHLQTVSLDFITALSIILGLTSLLLFFANRERPLETLGLFVLPMLPVAVVADALLYHEKLTINLNDGLGVHIFISMIAYSTLTLAALLAMLLAAKNRQLHNHKPGTLTRTLPPLQDMEALLFQLIAAGAFLLALGVITGFMFIDELFGKGVAHKAILTIVAWVVFTILLYGHWRYGWRGRKAIRWTMAGFIILMLAFLGSKFVVEYLVVNP